VEEIRREEMVGENDTGLLLRLRASIFYLCVVAMTARDTEEEGFRSRDRDCDLRDIETWEAWRAEEGGWGREERTGQRSGFVFCGARIPTRESMRSLVW
jgi:hypothetical protein